MIELGSTALRCKLRPIWMDWRIFLNRSKLPLFPVSTHGLEGRRTEFGEYKD